MRSRLLGGCSKVATVLDEQMGASPKERSDLVKRHVSGAKYAMSVVQSKSTLQSDLI